MFIYGLTREFYKTYSARLYLGVATAAPHPRGPVTRNLRSQGSYIDRVLVECQPVAVVLPARSYRLPERLAKAREGELARRVRRRHLVQPRRPCEQREGGEAASRGARLKWSS